MRYVAPRCISGRGTAGGGEMSDSPEDPLVILIDDDAAVREALGDLLNSIGMDTLAFA